MLEAEFGANQTTQFFSDDHVNGDGFGTSLAVDGDTALVGAWLHNGNRGAAYIFVRSREGWKQQAKLTLPEAALVNRFGRAVALDGDTAVVATRYGVATQEAAYVFKRENSGGDIRWRLETKLSPSDGAAGEEFGFAVGISGNVILIGSPYHASSPTSSGAVYVFRKIDDIWSPSGKLTPLAPSVRSFGQSLALQGNQAVIGAHMAAYVFTGPAWTQQVKLTPHPDARGSFFGNEVALEDDTILVGDFAQDVGAIDSGGVHIFMRDNNGTWALEDRLVAPQGGGLNDGFGRKVALKNGVALIGSAKGIQTGAGNGAAYLFKKSGNVWNLLRNFFLQRGSNSIAA